VTWAASADDEPCPEGCGQHQSDSGTGSPPRSPGPVAARVDLAIVAGGDGMILRSLAVASAAGVPVLGVNLGRRGFVAEVEPHGLPAAPAAIAAGRSVEERLALDVGVSSNDPARPLWTS
jgi:NAD kinase